MLVAIHIFFLAAISAWLWKRDKNPLHKFYWPALVVKCVAGISLGIIYSTYYETSDTFNFFRLASTQADLARTDLTAYQNFLFSNQEGYFLGEHRTYFFIKIISVLALITGNNYWITSLYLSLVSFFAAWYLVNTIARIFPDYKVSACIAFLFFPSVVFWSSGVIKESLAMAAMFFLTTLFLKLWTKEKISILSLLVAVICIVSVFNLKYYFLAVFIPIAFSSLIVRVLSDEFRIESFFKQSLIWVGILVLGFTAITFLHPNFTPAKMLAIITFNNKVFMDVCTPDDVIHFYNLQPTWTSMLVNAPWAFISGLFRPFVWEANTIFKFITAIENFLLLVLTAATIVNIKTVTLSKHKLLVLAIVLYCAILSVFLALSTPNFGTLARYGVGYLPFVVLLVFRNSFVTKLLARFF